MSVRFNPRHLRVQHFFFQEPTESEPNSYGETTLSWSNVADIPCTLETLSGRDLQNAQQQMGELTLRLECRHTSLLADAKPSWRIVNGVGGDIYEIVGGPMNLDNRNRVLRFHVKHTGEKDAGVAGAPTLARAVLVSPTSTHTGSDLVRARVVLQFDKRIKSFHWKPGVFELSTFEAVMRNSDGEWKRFGLNTNE